jgi:hypothetical protein
MLIIKPSLERIGQRHRKRAQGEKVGQKWRQGNYSQRMFEEEAEGTKVRLD